MIMRTPVITGRTVACEGILLLFYLKNLQIWINLFHLVYNLKNYNKSIIFLNLNS